MKLLRLYKPWRALGLPHLQHWNYPENSDTVFEQGVEKNIEPELITTSVHRTKVYYTGETNLSGL